ISASDAAPIHRSRPRRWPFAVLGLMVVAALAFVLLSGGDDGGTTAATTTRFPVGDGPDGVALGAGAVWVALSGEGKLARVDQKTGKTVKVDVGKSPDSVAFDGD